MKITELNAVLKSVEYVGGIFINLFELDNLLKSGVQVEMEECLITPYYIWGNKRMELYQFEFYCTRELRFEEYLLKLTEKQKIEAV